VPTCRRAGFILPEPHCREAKKIRVAIVSAGSPDYADLRAVTQPTRERYAEKHGYDLYFFEIPANMGDACKGRAYSELWGKGYDVMVWCDLDSCVMNSDIRIEDIVDKYMFPNVTYHTGQTESQDVHFLWGYDHGGPNSGVYIVRFTDEGRHWMNRVYATMQEQGLADETAMEILATTYPFKDYVRACPGVVLNSYDYAFYGWDRYSLEYQRKMNLYEPGRWILHMPGYPNSVRIPELKRRLMEAT
jgi:hypothetical protein